MSTTAAPAPSTRGVPTSDVDAFGHAHLEDPHLFHHELREAGPVVYLTRHNVYAIGRYGDVHAALTNWQGFQSGAGVGLSNFRTERPWRPPSLLLETDPPHHDAPRAVLSKVLGSRALRKLHDQWFADAEDLVENLFAGAGSGALIELDGMAALAEAFPLRVFPDAVGIPQDGRENLLPYGDHLFNAFGPANDLVAKGAHRVAELSGWVNAQCQRDVLTGDGFGAAIWAASDHGDITPEQAPLVVRSLLSAGVDTTVHGIGALLYCLATHPDQWQRLRQDLNLARIAFDEAVRVESPVQTFFRTATQDIAVGGTVIPDGHKILLFLGSANRDPRRWRDPEVFDLSRDPSGHVGFGMGLHQCVGQHVARLEAEALVTALAKRVRTIGLASQVGGEPPLRHHNNTMRAWYSMPLLVELI